MDSNPEGKHAGDVWNIPVLAGKGLPMKRSITYPKTIKNMQSNY